MPDKVFLDTNILVYAYSEDEPQKRQVAHQLLTKGHCWISTQVLNEPANVLLKRFKVSYGEVNSVLKEAQAHCHVFTVVAYTIEHAPTLAEQYHYSFYDSLIIAAALNADCQTLFSEDMHSGQLIETRLRIVNPFH